MKFDFSTASRIIFGPGILSSLPGLFNQLKDRPTLVIKGKEMPDPGQLFSILENEGIKYFTFTVKKEPDVETINSAVQFGRGNKCETVIGFGGGSVIDAGKAVAALLNNPGSLLDYLEVVGRGKPLNNRSKPFLAIPTTAGTGSEVTRNAVIAVPEKKVKVSMRHDYLLPYVALVDPQLTYGVPNTITASTGMDAFTQVVEPYVTQIANPMVDIFCREGIKRSAVHLLRAWTDGRDTVARENMAYVSLLGGLSLANAKLGAVHGFAGPIGGMFNAPHGAICAALLPAVMQVNSKLLSAQGNNQEKLLRFKQIAEWICKDEGASIRDGIEWIAAICDELEIPGLSDLGIKPIDFPLIIEKAKKSSSMKGNPVNLTDEEMAQILELSL